MKVKSSWNCKRGLCEYSME